MFEAQHIVEFWFAGTSDDKPLTKEQIGKWVNQQGFTATFIAAALRQTLQDAESGKLDNWRETPEGCLALVLLLDVFTRYGHAGSADVFKNDAKALAVAKHALSKGFDQQLSILKRLYLYLPFEHAEDLVLQEQSVRLYAELVKIAPTAIKKWVDAALSTAIAHRDVIEHFGRFPQRNALLERRATSDEMGFMAGLHKGTLV
jgi:uncharacterized protein (DUF924 family)